MKTAQPTMRQTPAEPHKLNSPIFLPTAMRTLVPWRGLATAALFALAVLGLAVLGRPFPGVASELKTAPNSPAITVTSSAGHGSPGGILLPAPDRTGGKPLMACLALRRTSRSFDTSPLDSQTLSNLLWAAAGVNRPETRLKTAPSARNFQEIDIFVAMENGVFIFNAQEHRLEPHLTGEGSDIREFVGKQPFTSVAPLSLIYVAREQKMKGAQQDEKIFYSAVDTGFISQNVYLFCASEGLATVVLGWVDKEGLAVRLGLPEGDRVILCQPVGHPAK